MSKQLIYILIAILGLAITFFTTSVHFDIKSIGVMAFFLVFIPTLIEPNIGLVIIIISTLFSPEMIVGTTSTREITIRVEDIFLLVVILAWFMRAVLTKNVAAIFRTKLTGPFFAYIFVCILSTAFAAMSGQIDLAHSSFAILKYFEYFLLFLIVGDNMRSLEQAKLFVLIFLLTALFVSISSNIYIREQVEMGTAFFRTAPPVETRGGGEAGTLGGYLLFIMAIAAGLLYYMQLPLPKIFLAGSLILMFRAFLYTLSRGSYLAILPMIAAFIFFSRKIILICAIIAGLILLAIFMPTMIKNRIVQTVTIQEDVGGPSVQLEESPRNRLQSWKDVLLVRVPASPIFGHGVGRFFIDGQIFLTLSETGLLGLFLSLWIIAILFKEAINVFAMEIVRNNGFSAGLSLGFLTGFIGLVAQALSTNTFIIIRIMEPFWFMAAIVVALPRLLKQETAIQENAG
ncbi:MAG: O-antigen ligase family protein [Candidatus Omnitrophica bacterium]|nr:O-antigen ligase family protein [Candidatus Omnitrophota bacterium]